jgi:hypothetical protein
MPFRLPPMPTKPEHRGQRLNSLLMVPIGIVSDRMEPKYTKDQLIIRAGKPVKLRASLDKTTSLVTYSIVSNDGSFIYPSFIIYCEGISPADFPSIARRAYGRFQHAMKLYDERFTSRMARWGRRQRKWEWKVLQKAIRHFDDEAIRFRRGTTIEMLSALTYEAHLSFFN